MTSDFKNIIDGIYNRYVSKLDLNDTSCDYEYELSKCYNYDFLKNLIPVAIEQEKYRALTRIFDFYEVPKNLSIKERICYYQLTKE